MKIGDEGKDIEVSATIFLTIVLKHFCFSFVIDYEIYGANPPHNKEIVSATLESTLVFGAPIASYNAMLCK